MTGLGGNPLVVLDSRCRLSRGTSPSSRANDRDSPIRNGEARVVGNRGVVIAIASEGHATIRRDRRGVVVAVVG